ncbi:MAG: 23S rRNA (guanosine(2251)-2'-O)-methyltransferase RlmB [Anaerolineales bacterium]|nr:23S rRNA (guanosine(2251)-2'-O)-methyltransferase RlmB [Anaerolineales bacterium]
MPEYLFRRNAVLEALRGERRPLRRLWLKKGQAKAQTSDLEAAARRRGLPIEYSDKQQLTRLAGDSSHQGAVLEADAFPYASLEEMLDLAARRRERPFLLILDLVQGPQNIGMLLRTAEACGVHGVIIQERRAPDITPHVVAFAAGATEHLLIARETNLAQTIQWLQQRNVWVVGLDMGEDAQQLGQLDLDMSLALVVGHEGEGLRRLVREKCDLILRLPMRGQVESLNAAVSGSIALYAAWQARGFQ